MNQLVFPFHPSIQRLLIVEYDQTLRDTFIEHFRLFGYEVTGVGSPNECLQEIAEEYYTLAIVDIGFSNQSGLKLGEYMRQHTDMHIIMLTSDASIEEKLICYESGADICMVNPVDCREL